MISSGDRTIASGEVDEAYCSQCGKSWPIEHDRCPDDGARLVKLVSKPDALIGRVFDGRYEIRTALGAGGMGTVYRGWQLSVDREVAIKVIHAKLASDRTAVKRFLREARLSSRLSMPGIVAVYDFGQTEDGILYLVMELIRGHVLSADLEAQRALPLKRVIAIGSHLCDALEAAHGQGIVHRDLKPGNIMVLDEPPGRDLLKVLDFGLSKSLVADTSTLLTQSSSLLGTPLYMAPEQIEGTPSDHRGDLYSLGCILYQLATGAPPFGGTVVNLILAAHISEPPPPLPGSVPPALARLILQLMEKSPEARPPSAALVRDALQASGDADVEATVPDVGAGRRSVLDEVQRRRQAKKKLVPWLILAIAAACVGIVVTIAARKKPPATSEPTKVQMTVTPAIDAAVPVDAPVDAPPVVVDAPIDAPPVHHATTIRRPPPVDAGAVAPVPTPDAPLNLDLLPTAH